MNKTKRKKKAKEQMVEIARSFSFKLNLGNYQSADFFASQKAECLEKDAKRVSEALYQFCKEEVTRAVNEVKREKAKAEEMKVRDNLPVVPDMTERKVRTKDDFIADAISKKRLGNDDDNTNGSYNSATAAGLREEYNQTFNGDNLDILAERNK